MFRPGNVRVYDNCVGVLVICVLVIIEYCVFVLFSICIFIISFVCTSVKDYCHRVTAQLW